MYKLSTDLSKFSHSNISEIENKRVIVRSCLNVAVDKEGNMTESTRFFESLPLIKELAEKAKKTIIMGHLGRPEGKSEGLSFKNNVFKALQAEGLKVELIEELSELNDKNESGVIYLIDNIRFFSNEESKDKEVRMSFAKELASLADVFINDAFPDYREAASTYDIATILPSYLGPVFMKEVEALSKFSTPERPFVAVIGGAKLSEKLDALNALAEIADKVIIGGAMAYTLLKSQGVNIGKSLVEEDKIEVAKEIMGKYANKLVLPVDHMIAGTFEETAEYSYTNTQEIPDGQIAIDLGKVSIENARNEIAKAKSILWNGPMGVIEWSHSAEGTKALGEAIAKNEEAYVLAGGGDSIAAINKYSLTGFDHISTGGGAMLSFLAYDKFPILDVILG